MLQFVRYMVIHVYTQLVPNIIIVWCQCTGRYTGKFTKSRTSWKLQAEIFIDERIISNVDDDDDDVSTKQ